MNAIELIPALEPVIGGNKPRFTIPPGFLVGTAARKKLEDLDQVPFPLSRLKIELEGKQLKVTFKKLPY